MSAISIPMPLQAIAKRFGMASWMKSDMYTQAIYFRVIDDTRSTMQALNPDGPNPDWDACGSVLQKVLNKSSELHKWLHSDEWEIEVLADEGKWPALVEAAALMILRDYEKSLPTEEQAS